jgi:hypothetical protein
MPRPNNWSRVCAGLVVKDRVLFRRHFFRDQLSLEPSTEQKLMWCDNSQRVLFCTGRKLAKTISIESEILQVGLLHKSLGDGVDEALMWTPNDVHMVPLVDRIFSRIDRNAIFTGCVRERRRGDNTILEFRGGLRWYFRIEGLNGTDKNVVGLRACILLGDEQAFGQESIYKSLIMSAMPNARWIMAGVPNGVRRSPFYQLDQTKLGDKWSRHKYTTYINPLYYGPEAKARLIDDYGGENTHGYKTQVLGEWGEEMFTSFPPGAIAIGEQKFFNVELSRLEKEDIDRLPLRIGVGSIRCKRFIISLDYGYSPDPSILGGFYSDDDEARVWRQFLQIQMNQVAQPHQVDVILYVMKSIFHGQFMGFASDHLSTVQSLQQKVTEEQAGMIMHSSPGSSTEFNLKVIRDEEPDLYRVLSEEDRKKETVNIHNKQLWTEWMRNWMINANQGIDSTQLWLANIPETIGELGGTTEKKGERGGYIVYDSPRDPNDSKRKIDHRTDSIRYAAAVIHEAIKKRDIRFSEEELVKSMGWAGEIEEGQEWNPAWGGTTA